MFGPVPLELQDDLSRGLVVGRLEDLDHVVAPERDVDADEAAAGLADDPLAVFDPLTPGREPRNALGRPAHEGHVVRHKNDDDARSADLLTRFGRFSDAFVLLTRQPRRPGLLPEATVAAKVGRVGNAGVTEATIREATRKRQAEN